MQIKKTLALFAGLPVLIAGVIVAVISANPTKIIPADHNCPVKCCQEKKGTDHPASTDNSYPESRSIFLPDNFFTGV